MIDNCICCKKDDCNFKTLICLFLTIIILYIFLFEFVDIIFMIKNN